MMTTTMIDVNQSDEPYTYRPIGTTPSRCCLQSTSSRVIVAYRAFIDGDIVGPVTVILCPVRTPDTKVGAMSEADARPSVRPKPIAQK